jgi:hypothetical protein
MRAPVPASSRLDSPTDAPTLAIVASIWIGVRKSSSSRSASVVARSARAASPSSRMANSSPPRRAQHAPGGGAV